MWRDGSPAPVFESDDDRTLLQVNLPVHEQPLLAAPEQDKSLTNQADVQLTPKRPNK